MNRKQAVNPNQRDYPQQWPLQHQGYVGQQYYNNSFHNQYWQMPIPQPPATRFMRAQIIGFDPSTPPPPLPSNSPSTSCQPHLPPDDFSCNINRRKYKRTFRQQTEIQSNNTDNNSQNQPEAYHPPPSKLLKISWTLEDANKAIDIENELSDQKNTNASVFMLRFPDPELSPSIVKGYSDSIEMVTFQQPYTPRYCFIKLKDGSDENSVVDQISKINFGIGKIQVFRRINRRAELPRFKPNQINPTMLYIGNIPLKMSVKTVKELLNNPNRVDIGFTKRVKYCKYALARYSNVDAAIEAFKLLFNKPVNGRTLIVRFMRQKINEELKSNSTANADDKLKVEPPAHQEYPDNQSEPYCNEDRELEDDEEEYDYRSSDQRANIWDDWEEFRTVELERTEEKPDITKLNLQIKPLSAKPNTDATEQLDRSNSKTGLTDSEGSDDEQNLYNTVFG